MFYEDMLHKALTRSQLLAEKITGFYESYEKILKRVTYKNIVRCDLLPTRREVEDLYDKNGVPKVICEAMSLSYECKVMLLEEFQQGKKLSLYKK